MLDDHMNTRRDMHMYGNMTEAEKKFNRNDLVSYKNKEHVSYGMIPGIQSQVQSPTKTVLEKRDKREHKPDKTLRTIDEFGSTYLRIPDLRAQDKRFQAPEVQFPNSPGQGNQTFHSQKVHPLYRSVDPALSNAQVLAEQRRAHGQPVMTAAPET